MDYWQNRWTIDKIWKWRKPASVANAIYWKSSKTIKQMGKTHMQHAENMGYRLYQYKLLRGAPLKAVRNVIEHTMCPVCQESDNQEMCIIFSWNVGTEFVHHLMIWGGYMQLPNQQHCCWQPWWAAGQCSTSMCQEMCHLLPQTSGLARALPDGPPIWGRKLRKFKEEWEKMMRNTLISEVRGRLQSCHRLQNRQSCCNRQPYFCTVEAAWNNHRSHWSQIYNLVTWVKHWMLNWKTISQNIVVMGTSQWCSQGLPGWVTHPPGGPK